MTKHLKLGLFIGLPTATIIGLAIPTAVIGAQRIDEAEKHQSKVEDAAYAAADYEDADGNLYRIYSGTFAQKMAHADMIAILGDEDTKGAYDTIEENEWLIEHAHLNKTETEAAEKAISDARDIINTKIPVLFGFTKKDEVTYDIDTDTDVLDNDVFVITAYSEHELSTGKVVSAEATIYAYAEADIAAIEMDRMFSALNHNKTFDKADDYLDLAKGTVLDNGAAASTTDTYKLIAKEFDFNEDSFVYTVSVDTTAKTINITIKHSGDGVVGNAIKTFAYQIATA